MDNDTYLSNSDVINKLDDLSAAVSGTVVPTTTTKTNSDFVIGINKSIDAASGKTGVEYPPYSHNTLVTSKLDELAEAISEGGGGGPGPTPVMGALSVTENGEYLPSSYNYDGFSSVSVNIPAPTPTVFTPEFSETLLIDNSNYDTSFTFTDDYHNYDIVKVIICNPGSGEIFGVIHTTPSTLDKCFSFAWGLVCFDRHDSSDHCDYTQNGLTWTISDQYRSTNCIIKEIYGIKCTNGTAVETTIHDHNSLSNPLITINYDGSFKDEFDILFICANSTDGDADEIMPTINQIYTDTLFYRDSVGITLNRYNNYNNITFTDNSLSSWYYFFVVGLKFIPST